MTDLISRQEAIKAVGVNTWAGSRLNALPSAEPTLYGYKIEHLAYIARVMEMEGITAEQAVHAFEDLGMAVRLITEEAQQKIEEAIYDYNTGKI